MKPAPYAVVPVKIMAHAKTRLAPALSFARRLRLARELLHHTLSVLARYPGPTRTIVVSPDAGVLRLARSRGMIALPQTAHGGINRAVSLGCRHARSRGAVAVLTVPIDLPLLSAGSLRRFARPSAEPVIRVAPDRSGAGTNALYMQPVRVDFSRFGDGSFRRHRARSAELGLREEIEHHPELAFDVDVPEDLALLASGDSARTGRMSRTARTTGAGLYLRRIGARRSLIDRRSGPGTACSLHGCGCRLRGEPHPITS
ncbi:MAG: 2-phospho-L-lactate guanylyltransferase [Reyranellaceae bacterium]